MGIVAALLPNPGSLARLRAALRDRHDVELCTDWPGLTRVCQRQAVHLAVLDLYASGRLELDPVRQLRRLLPRLSTVAYVQHTPDRTRDLFDAGRVGIDALVLADSDDDPAMFARTLEQAEARGVANLARAHFSSLRPTVRDALLVTITRAHQRLSADSVARTLTLSRRALTRRLSDEGFPPPQQLVTWGRLIVASYMLEDNHRSADGVASALDFPSGSAFRNTCQRYVQATPGEIRSRGGCEFVIRALLASVERSRAERPAGGTPPVGLPEGAGLLERRPLVAIA